MREMGRSWPIKIPDSDWISRAAEEMVPAEKTDALLY